MELKLIQKWLLNKIDEFKKKKGKKQWNHSYASSLHYENKPLLHPP